MTLKLFLGTISEIDFLQNVRSLITIRFYDEQRRRI